MTILEANKPFSDGLRMVIAKKGLKQSCVARKAGYTSQELSDMLNGRRLIKACDIPRLSQALDVQSDFIYEVGKEGDGNERESRERNIT